MKPPPALSPRPLSFRVVPEKRCKNCGHHFRGIFCSQCGQKTAHRLGLFHILHEGVHVFTHTDKGIFALIPALLFRPGIIAREYVEGKRKKHFSVFQYLILIVGLALLVISQGHLIDRMVGGLPAAPGSGASSSATAQQEVAGTIRQYFNLFLFLTIPVFAFFSWLFFRSKGYNYAEHFVLQATIQAQIHTCFVLIIFPLVYFFGHQALDLIILLASTILAVSNTLANRQFFRVSRAEAFFKGFLITICTNGVQVLLIFLVFAVVTKG